MNRLRHGASLLEFLVASAILAGALVPIVQSFYTLTVGYRKTTASTHGAFLAAAVMENIRYRLYNFDARYYTLNDAEPERVEKVTGGAWKRFFEELAEAEGASVVETPDGVSDYFLLFENLQGSSLHPVRESSNPFLWKSLAGYSCEVGVAFDFDGAAELFDPDGNGKRQTDMARVLVVIRWLEQVAAVGSVETFTRESRFETVLTRHQYEPYEIQ